MVVEEGQVIVDLHRWSMGSIDEAGILLPNLDYPRERSKGISRITKE